MCINQHFLDSQPSASSRDRSTLCLQIGQDWVLVPRVALHAAGISRAFLKEITENQCINWCGLLVRISLCSFGVHVVSGWWELSVKWFMMMRIEGSPCFPVWDEIYVQCNRKKPDCSEDVFHIPAIKSGSVGFISHRERSLMGLFPVLCRNGTLHSFWLNLSAGRILGACWHLWPLCLAKPVNAWVSWASDQNVLTT